MLHVALLPSILVALRQTLGAQTTYTSYAFSTLAGTAGVTGSADGTGSAAQFYSPDGLAVDATGNVYVADSGNCTIRKITAGGVVTTLAGTAGVHGSADGTGSAAQFYSPDGLAVDATGNVYVADSGNYTIRKIAAGGVVTTLAGSAGVHGSADGTGSAAQFSIPDGIAVDGSGYVYVADAGNNTIRRITPSGAVTTFAGTAGVSGSVDGTGAAARFNYPTGVAVDGSGNVYVADMANDTIRKITPGGVVTTLAGSAGIHAGIQGSADGTGSAARFNMYPSACLAADEGGNVYVSDSGNSTVRKVTAGGVVTTLAGLPGLEGSVDGIGPVARFRYPQGIAVDWNGNVYVADPPNETIRAGYAVNQASATVTLAGLSQMYDGTAKNVSATTVPAGLATLVLYLTPVYSGEYDSLLAWSATAPTSIGSYPVFATIIDPDFTGTAVGTLMIGPPLATQPSFTVRNAREGGNFLRGIAAGAAGLVAVGDNGTVLASTNGSQWTLRQSGVTDSLYGVTYGGGQYVAVGDNGRVLLSTDGVSWSSVASSATAARLNNVVYAIGQYVAVGDGGTIINSPDGRSWTARNSGVSGWLRGLAYTTGCEYESDYGTAYTPAEFLATGQGGVLVSSPDGITWTPQSMGGGDDLEAVLFPRWPDYLADNGFFYSDFIAVGADGAMAFGDRYFMGGSSYIPVRFSGLFQGAGELFATGENGTIVTAGYAEFEYWPTGGTWSQLSSGTTAELVAGAAIGDSVFIVGENETILQTTQPPDSRLVNLSCRAQVGTGANILITGFVAGGQGTSGSMPMLIRGSGPALVPFGVSGTLADPTLQLYSTSSGSSLIAANAGWGGSSAILSAAAAVGAFPWADPLSHNAALLETLAPGPYTANVSGTSGDAGVALAEIYDATPDGMPTVASPRLINISARSRVGTEGNSLIAGFVIGGSTRKTVLIRASGPALRPFGVVGALPDPELQVYSTTSGSTLVASNTGWNGDVQIAASAAWVGAFPWGASATPDSALLLTLPPGPYTANVTGAGGDTGVALIEIYEVR